MSAFILLAFALQLGIARVYSAATPTPQPTTIASTRFTIDTANLAFAPVSDADFVSAGAFDHYSDNLGSLVSTAVLIKTPNNPSMGPTFYFVVSRVDLLLYMLPQASRVNPSDLTVSLFTNSVNVQGHDHDFPGLRIATASLSSATAQLRSDRAQWYPVTVTWPVTLDAGSYYWVVLAPSTPLSMPNGLFNGVLWSGLNASVNSVPTAVAQEPFLFAARQLISQRLPGDAAFAADKSAAAGFISTAQNWTSLPSAAARVTNWHTAGSRIYYGVQLIGQAFPVPSTSPSPTPSSIQSASQASAQSAVPSSSISPSSSASLSSSLSSSVSPSSSVSSFEPPIPSGPPTVGGLPSVPASMSSSSSSSDSMSASATGTQTLSRTASKTVSSTRTVSRSYSPSQSPTASLLPSFYVVLAPRSSYNPLPPQSGTTQPALAIELSDSLPPPGDFSLWLSGCPPVPPPYDPSIDVTLLEASCSLSTSGVVWSASLPTPTSPLACVPAVSGVQVPVLLASRVGLRALFRAQSGESDMVCTASIVAARNYAQGDPRYVSYSSTVATVRVTPTLWPLWADAIVVSSFGFARSSLTARRVNATSTILEEANALVGLLSTESNINSSIGSSCGPGHSPLSCPAAILAGVERSMEAVVPLETFYDVASYSNLPAITLTGSTLIVLRAKQRAFVAGLVAKLGRAACTTEAISVDGEWALLRTPPAAALCTGMVDCGYQTLVVTVPAATATVSRRRTAFDPPEQTRSSDAGNGSARLVYFRGATLSSPPFYDGGAAVQQGSFPVPQLGALPGVFVSAIDTTAPPSVFVALLPIVRGRSSVGVYYARACNASGLYTDPLSGACTNASDPASVLCAYGSGDDCELCATQGLCPGGFRVWPRPGFWITSEAADPSSIQPCIAPALERCAGWDSSIGASQCGAGYRVQSFLCASCADGFFDTGSHCSVCPLRRTLWEVFYGIIELTLFVLAGIIVIYAFLFAMVKCWGGTITGAAMRAFELSVWSFTVLQSASMVAITVEPAIPGALATLYDRLVLLQLEKVVTAPACTGTYAFLTEAVIMSCALFFWFATFAVYYVRRVLFSIDDGSSEDASDYTIRVDSSRRLNSPRRRTIAQRCFCRTKKFHRIGTLSTIGRMTLGLATFLYPAACTTTLRLLDCTLASFSSISAIQTLDWGTRSDASIAEAYASNFPSSPSGGAPVDSDVAISVLRRDPYYVCWAGSHRPAGALAIVTLVFYSLGMPLLVLLWILQPPHDSVRSHVQEAASRLDPLSSTSPVSTNGANSPTQEASSKLDPLSSTSPQGPTNETNIVTAGASNGVTTSAASPTTRNTRELSFVTESVPFLKKIRMLATAATFADPLLAPFLVDYRPAFWFSRHLDLMLLFLLALFRAFALRPSSVPVAIGKAVIISCACFALAAWVVIMQPFVKPQGTWMQPVRVLLLCVTAGAAALNVCAAAVSHGWPAPESLPRTVYVGGFLLLIAWSIALFALLLGFGRSMWVSAVLEARQLRRARRDEQRRQAAAALPHFVVTEDNVDLPRSDSVVGHVIRVDSFGGRDDTQDDDEDGSAMSADGDNGNVAHRHGVDEVPAADSASSGFAAARSGEERERNGTRAASRAGSSLRPLSTAIPTRIGQSGSPQGNDNVRTSNNRQMGLLSGVSESPSRVWDSASQGPRPTGRPPHNHSSSSRGMPGPLQLDSLLLSVAPEARLDILPDDPSFFIPSSDT